MRTGVSVGGHMTFGPGTVVEPYGSVVSAKLKRRVPCAVLPGMYSTGVMLGVFGIVDQFFSFVMYMEPVFHWLIIMSVDGFTWNTVGAGTL